MIHFFRKVRQKLLAQNRFSKYLLYAIGEIILVVIGILIALQINTWSGNYKDRQKLKTTLVALHNDIVKDSISIYRDLLLTEEEVEHDSILIVRLKDNRTTYDSLVQMVRNDFKDYAVARINYNRSVFDNLIATGNFELLSDTLRNSMTKYYTFLDYRENISQLVSELYIGRLQMFNQQVITTGLNDLSPHLNEIIWNDIDKRQFTNQFLGVISMRRTLWWSYRRELNQVLAQTREQIKLINSRLDEYQYNRYSSSSSSLFSSRTNCMNYSKKFHFALLTIWARPPG